MDENLENREHPLIDKIAEIAGILFEHGWAEAFSGNFSVRLTDAERDQLIGEFPFLMPTGRLEEKHAIPDLAGLSIVIKACGSRMRQIRSDPRPHLLLMEIGDNGVEYVLRATEPGSREPSSEFLTHLAVQAAKRGDLERRFVLHAHTTGLNKLGHLETDHGRFSRLLAESSPETAELIPEGVAFLDYIRPGTIDLARATADSLRQKRVAVWRCHGAVAVGPDFDSCLDLLEIADKAAEMCVDLWGKRDKWHAPWSPEGRDKGGTVGFF